MSGGAVVKSDRAGGVSCSRILVLDASFKDGELLTEGEIFKSQPRAVPEEGMEEPEDDSEDGHRALPGRRAFNGLR